jgi:hypothetical protein
MEDESNWVVNGIITISLIILVLPLVAGVVESLDALVLLVAIMYVTYTVFSGEAIDPHQPK